MISRLSGPSRPPPPAASRAGSSSCCTGSGADGNDLIGLQHYWARLLPDAEFLSPNAPFPCDMAPYGYQWFSSQDRSPEAVLAGVRAAAPILDAFIDEALEKRGLAAERPGAGRVLAGHDDVALRRAAPRAAGRRHSRLSGPAARARAAGRRAALASAGPSGSRHRRPAGSAPPRWPTAKTALKGAGVPVETRPPAASATRSTTRGCGAAACSSAQVLSGTPP